MIRFTIARNKFLYLDFKRLYFEKKQITWQLMLVMAAMLGLGQGFLIGSMMAFFITFIMFLIPGVTVWGSPLLYSTVGICLSATFLNEIPAIVHEKLMRKDPTLHR